MCLSCGASHPAVPVVADNDLVASPFTAGQREERYCGPCCRPTIHEFSARPVAPLRSPNDFSSPAPRVAGHQVVASDFIVGTVVATQPSSSSAASSRLPDVGQLSDDELERLRQAVDNELAARRKCVVCFEMPKTVIFYPCKHQCCCRGCAPRVDHCPVCRSTIGDRISPFA